MGLVRNSRSAIGERSQPNGVDALIFGGNMKIYDNNKIDAHPKVYLSHAQVANCMICGERKDLRCGACFQCVDKVGGKPIKNNLGATIGHRLYEINHPENSWITGQPTTEQ